MKRPTPPLPTILFAAALVAVGLGHPATAEPLPPEWQSRREQTIELTARACKNDAQAMAEVKRRFDNADPVMMNSAGWLHDNCEAYKSMPLSDVAAYQERAAKAGYPVAQYNYAERLILGGRGVEKDVERGLKMHESALMGGFGVAALRLAHHYSNGTNVPRDIAKARTMLRYAEAENVPAKQIETFRTAVEERADAERNAQNAALPGQFAALAVSTADGGYGFADDYPDAQSARARAAEECRTRGGSDCEIKMVGKGKGCMAYHSAGGSATAHGWAIGPTSATVETRAAQECRTRNDNTNCGNSAWVCNDRTEAPLEVLFEAPMPGAASAGAGCRISVTTQVCNFDNRTSKPGRKPYGALSPTEYLNNRVQFEGCGSKYAKYLNFKPDGQFSKDSWHADRDVPPQVIEDMRPLALAFRDAAIAHFGCDAPPDRRSMRVTFHAPQTPESYFENSYEWGQRPDATHINFDFEWP